MPIGGNEVGVLQPDGSLSRVATESIHREILAHTGKANPTVLFIPTAKDDSEEYIIAFKHFYGQLGCNKFTVLRLIHEKPTQAEISTLIDSADAIYVNGGNTHNMMKIWKKRGVIDLLKKAYKKGTIMAGHSAGAFCWFSAGNSDSFNKRRPFKSSAIGIINAVLCPHFDTEKFRQQSLKKMMKKTHRIIAIALDENSAIEIVDNNYRILQGNKSAGAYKAFWQNGKYRLIELDITPEYKSLSLLLSKTTV